MSGGRRCAWLRGAGGLGLALLAAGLCATGCRGKGGGAAEVVVYTSVDQVYAQDVFARFTERTGIRVSAVFDTEAGKTTGLYRRLLAERSRPRADVFWNNELCRTIQLAAEGLAADLSPLVPDDIPRRWVDPGGRWAAFSLRARAIVYNTAMVTKESAPKTLHELTEEPWRGKVAMANPLFGTTASHVAALCEVMGEEEAENFLRALKANGVRLVEGNSVVRDLVAHGEVAVGLTDTDDIFSGIDNGSPIALVLPDQEGMGTFVIPNSVLLVGGGPHPSSAEAFVRFLLSREVEELLAFTRARQLPVRADVPRPPELAAVASLRAMDVDYGKVAQRMPAVARRVEQLLFR